MRNRLIDQFADHLMVVLPLLQRKIFDTIAKEELPPVRLSQAGARVLILLHEVRRSIVSDLSEQLNMTRSNISPVVDKLVKLGLAARVPSAEDRRLVYVEITPQGDWVCAEYGRVVSAKIRSMIEFLDETELRELNMHMEQIKKILLRSEQR